MGEERAGDRERRRGRGGKREPGNKRRQKGMSEKRGGWKARVMLGHGQTKHTKHSPLATDEMRHKGVRGGGVFPTSPFHAQLLSACKMEYQTHQQ